MVEIKLSFTDKGEYDHMLQSLMSAMLSAYVDLDNCKATREDTWETLHRLQNQLLLNYTESGEDND